MLFLKRTLPLIITFVVGVIMLSAFFAGPSLRFLSQLETTFPHWIRIILNFTMILGAVSLFRVNLQKISRKVDGYGYSIVLVVGFVSMTFLGMVTGGWPMFESEVKIGDNYHLFSGNNISSEPVTVVDIVKQEGLDDRIIVETDDGRRMGASEGRLRTTGMGWLLSMRTVVFEGVFKAAQATMFSLLAFYVASASFRAFRVKSKEAALLMGSAFIVMLGNVPLGKMLSDLLAYIPFIGVYMDIPALKEWIIDYPSSAAQSAIIIGAVLGMVSASIKIILGIERSHLGGRG